MSITEAFSLVVCVGLTVVGLVMTAQLLKEEIAKIHNELRYMNGKTNRLIQLSRMTIEPPDIVQGQPIVLADIPQADFDQVMSILFDVEKGGAD